MQQQVRTRRCTVYRGQARPRVQTVELVPESKIRIGSPPVVTNADRVRLSEIMASELVCASRDLGLSAIADLMVRHHIGCLPVVDERRHPVGMITKSDLAEQLAELTRPAETSIATATEVLSRTAEQVMMPLAFSLDEDSSVAHAAAMMMTEDVHHVLVIAPSRVLVGVVSSKDIVGWMVSNDGTVAPQFLHKGLDC